MNSLYAEVYALAGKVFQLNHDGKVGQDRLTQEECIEASIEYLALAKDINKNERGTLSNENLIGEIIDVFASGYAMLKGLGVSDDYILSQMIYKYKRAIYRNEESKRSS